MFDAVEVSMPLLTIESNSRPTNEAALLAQASQQVAAMLSKPERFVMVRYTHQPHMLFAGKAEPLAFLSLKSIGLPQDQTQTFSAQLCQFINEQLGVPTARIYIEFANVERPLWGWDGQTFEK